mgnify:CR=1 FL=1
MKKLIAMFDVFELFGDSFSDCVERRFRKPAHAGFVSHHIATALHEQGDVVGVSGLEMLADSAMYQERHHNVS